MKNYLFYSMIAGFLAFSLNTSPANASDVDMAGEVDVPEISGEAGEVDVPEVDGDGKRIKAKAHHKKMKAKKHMKVEKHKAKMKAKKHMKVKKHKAKMKAKKHMKKHK